MPYLYARIVDNLRVCVDSAGVEKLLWTEPEKGYQDEHGKWQTTDFSYDDSWKPQMNRER